MEGIVIKEGKSIYTEIVIDANPEKVWKVFDDFGSYGEWNPFLKSITGEVRTGSRIKALLSPPDGMAMTMSPKVLRFERNKSLVWMGSLGLPWIFDGEHHFEFRDMGNGKTLLAHYEIFRGILVPLLQKMLDVNTKNGFEMMNRALKERVEKG